MSLRSLTLILFTLSILSVARSVSAQDPNVQVRDMVPWGSYQHSDVDSVNMMNGGLTIHIPLYSLLQRGRLSLSFSLAGTSPAYTYSTYQCNMNSGTSQCYFTQFAWGSNAVKPSASNPITPIFDQGLSVSDTMRRYPANSNTFYNIWTIRDATGSIHELGYDNSNRSILRATDGTGFLFVPVNTTPYSPLAGGSGGYTLYDPSGIKHIADSSGNTSISDPDGNSIATNAPTIIDSLGRQVPSIPGGPTSSSTAGCPAVTALYQATTGSATWTVPGPNGAQLTYLFCFTSVFLRTNFFGGCVKSEQTCTGNYDTASPIAALQSVVLPNQTYYLFTYSAANPSDHSSYAYDDLTQIRLPSGGTINYQYTNAPSTCTASTCTGNGSGVVVVRGVSRRTFDPGNGGQQVSWAYIYPTFTQTTLQTTATDALGNDNVYTFSYLGPGSGAYETKFQAFQGPQSAGKALLTKTTAYQIAASDPQANGGGTISNLAVLPTTVTTTLDSGQSTTTTYQYNDGGFQDIQPGCTVTGATTYSCTWSATQQIPFGLQTSTSISDYGGATLQTLQTQYLYQQNSSYQTGNFLNLIASATTLNASGTQVAKTTYGYDENNGSPQGTYGHQTSINRWLNTTNTNATTKTVYNTQGMPTQSIDPLLNATVSTYDATGAFLSKIQRPDTGSPPVHHITSYTYDSVSGKPLTVTDENSNTTTYNYDNFGRLISTSMAGTVLSTNCYSDVGGTTCPQSGPPFQVVNTKVISSSAGSITNTTLYDMLGRIVQTQLNSDPDGATFVDTTYDPLGQVKTQSNPHRSTSAATDGTTTNYYDALGRICLVVPPDGTLPTGNTCPTSQPSNTIFTTYSGNCTTVTDQAGKSRTSCTDGLGRLTQVFEDPGSSPHLNYESDYTYDALGDLLTVNQKGNDPNSANWRTRTFTYDSLSRLLCASNPENSSAPCPATATTSYTMGTIGYAYDANGNLSTKTSPKPNQTGTATVVATFSYDALNRLTQKSFNDGSTPTVNYVYDGAAAPTGCTPPTLTITNPIGRRTGMCDAAGSEAWAYDSMGRTTADNRITNNLVRLTGYTYNLDGSTARISYSGSETVVYAPGGAGRPLSAAGGNTYVTNAHYMPTGAVCYFQSSAGSGGVWIHNYTFNNRLQPATIQVINDYTSPPLPQPVCGVMSIYGGGNTNTALDLRYTFTDVSGHNNGNVISIAEGNGSSYLVTVNPYRNQSFTYDALNRLATAKTASTYSTNSGVCWAETYNYDSWGNLLKLGADTTNQSAYIGCTQESGFDFTNFTNNKNQINASGYVYDAAGNLTASPGVGIVTFNAENQIVSAGGVTYTYDGDGKRVMKSSGTIYWYGAGSDPLQETDLTGAMLYQHVYFNGMRIARWEWHPNCTTFDHYALDHLGNARFVWGCRGNGAGGWDVSSFYPFGGERPVNYNCCVGNTFKITGKERDSESGLDNFGARFDSSTLGRFTSPDWSDSVEPVPYADFSNPLSLNLYAYVRGNPANAVDLDGHNCWSDPNGGIHCTVYTNPLSELEISSTLRNLQFAIGNAAGRANEYLHLAAEFWSRRPGAGCLAAATGAGAAAGASYGVAAGPVVQAALVPVTLGGSEALGGPPGGALLGGFLGGAGGAAAGNVFGQVVCRIGAGGSSGSGGGNSGGGGRATGSSARLTNAQQRQTAEYLGMKEVKGMTSQGQLVFEKDGRYFSFSNTGHAAGEVFKELDRNGNRIATTDLYFNRIGK